MLEKTRIHRAMLTADEASGFSARDLVKLTAAKAATVRKTLERAVADGVVEACGSRPPPGRGGPEKLFRLTALGRRAFAENTALIYAALVAAPRANGAEPASAPPDGEASGDTSDALDAALQTLGTLRGAVCGLGKLLDRLAIASAELAEASRASGEAGLRALAIQPLVREAIAQAETLLEGDEVEVQLLCARILRALDEINPVSRIAFTDRVFALLPVVRRQAVELVSSRCEAETLVQNLYSQLFADATAAALNDDALTSLALHLLRDLAEQRVGSAQEITRLLLDIKAGQDAAVANVARLVNGLSVTVSTGLDEIKRIAKPEIDVGGSFAPVAHIIQGSMSRGLKYN